MQGRYQPFFQRVVKILRLGVRVPIMKKLPIGGSLKSREVELVFEEGICPLHLISKLGGNCPRYPPGDAPEDLPYKMNKIC